jgi:sarcosine oxidase
MSELIIVGAGIVGLSTAHAAARRGHRVTLLERGPAPNPQSASFDQHRMIRFHYGAAAGYTRMVTEAFAAWERLWTELGERHFADCGAVAVSLQAGDYADQTEAVFRDLGVPHETVQGAALARLLPQLDLPPSARGVLAHPGGPLFADRIVTALHRLCESQGVRILPHCPVTAIDDDGSVRTAAGETLRADRVIVAAGAWLPRLLPARFGDLPTHRQALCYVEAPRAHAAAWANGPALVVIGDRGVYSLPPLAGTGLKFGDGAHRRKAAPEAGFDWSIDEGREIIDAFSPFLRDADDYAPLRMQVGYYVMDGSRRFRIETAGKCLFVTNCDGQMFKFGPAVGERIVACCEGTLAPDDLAQWAAGGQPQRIPQPETRS